MVTVSPGHDISRGEIGWTKTEKASVDYRQFPGLLLNFRLMVVFAGVGLMKTSDEEV